MTRSTHAGLLLALVVLCTAVVPGAVAAQPADTVDECKNAETGPGQAGGPPGFVGDLVPDFLADLLSSLPVPGFVKSLFGASGC